jgi:hypothetical protein
VAAFQACSSTIRSKLAGQSLAAWEFGLSIREYRELEAGERSPSFATWGRICKVYGWPQTFSEGAGS